MDIVANYPYIFYFSIWPCKSKQSHIFDFNVNIQSADCVILTVKCACVRRIVVIANGCPLPEIWAISIQFAIGKHIFIDNNIIHKLGICW